jgi:nitrite reductase/ring-hydroxylating ferredoxin subunit
MKNECVLEVQRTLGFVKVASAKALSAGTMIGANVDGKYYAIGDKCTHRGCKLSGGTLKGSGVVGCPCHGSNFDVKTGNVVKGPAKTSEPAFQVKVEKDDVLVDI